MKHPVVIESLQLILAGDIEGAERALVAIAEEEGDHALVAVLDQMPPKDLLAVMREFDSSKESLVNMVVTPEQFARAIVLEKKYGDRTGEKLRAMMNAVIHRDSHTVGEYLEEIDESLGFGDAIASSRPKVSRAEIADGDWMETAWVLRHELEDEFEQIVMALRDRWQRLVEAQLLAEAGPQVAKQHVEDDTEESAI